MAEEKKNQGNDALEGEATEGRQECKLSALIAQAKKLFDEAEPKQEMFDEFLQQATSEDVQRLLWLEAFAGKLSQTVISKRADDCLRSAQEEGASPMAAMQKLEKELGELGFEIGGIIGMF